ncbi:MAG TPA: hypothetical protein VGZ00_01185 [Candidatus Baltobacteraceae bacterium]|jgi:hypothetical protein|nr:hypothetical protein [Candidatus Baltobacteraceae bacterium]
MELIPLVAFYLAFILSMAFGDLLEKAVLGTRVIAPRSIVRDYLLAGIWGIWFVLLSVYPLLRIIHIEIMTLGDLLIGAFTLLVLVRVAVAVSGWLK